MHPSQNSQAPAALLLQIFSLQLPCMHQYASQDGVGGQLVVGLTVVLDLLLPLAPPGQIIPSVNKSGVESPQHLSTCLLEAKSGRRASQVGERAAGMSLRSIAGCTRGWQADAVGVRRRNWMTAKLSRVSSKCLLLNSTVLSICIHEHGSLLLGTSPVSQHKAMHVQLTRQRTVGRLTCRRCRASGAPARRQSRSGAHRRTPAHSAPRLRPGLRARSGGRSGTTAQAHCPAGKWSECSRSAVDGCGNLGLTVHLARDLDCAPAVGDARAPPHQRIVLQEEG